ncbi:MAG: hypothetical protein J6U98_02825 [Abditibacteriota bacterium]|nr:hypothetical protein [Abditibacteriota bacterium]MBP5738614.1 hypothetical protein [Abditibacteriota bacterium]
MVGLDILWTDRCDVTLKGKQTDPDTLRTTFNDVTLITNRPCRVSFESIPASAGEPVQTHLRNVKLFLSNAVPVPPGSKITVTRGGQTMTFKSSGAPAIYSTHQEVNLTEGDQN